MKLTLSEISPYIRLGSIYIIFNSEYYFHAVSASMLTYPEKFLGEQPRPADFHIAFSLTQETSRNLYTIQFFSAAHILCTFRLQSWEVTCIMFIHAMVITLCGGEIRQ